MHSPRGSIRGLFVFHASGAFTASHHATHNMYIPLNHVTATSIFHVRTLKFHQKTCPHMMMM